jgi:hypothetical protein
MKQLPNMVSEAAASTCKSSTRGRCPDIHRHVDNRRNKASSPRRCLQEGNDVAAAIARPGTRSLGFLPESRNHRGRRRSSTTSVSKKKNDAGAPSLPAPTNRCWVFARNISTPPREQAALLFSCRHPPRTNTATSTPTRRPPARGRSTGTSSPTRRRTSKPWHLMPRPPAASHSTPASATTNTPRPRLRATARTPHRRFSRNTKPRTS